jgi:hypothetical protein
MKRVERYGGSFWISKGPTETRDDSQAQKKEAVYVVSMVKRVGVPAGVTFPESRGPG